MRVAYTDVTVVEVCLAAHESNVYPRAMEIS